MGNYRQKEASLLGSAIRNRRRQLHLNQSELAGLAGVSVTYLCQLESGKARAQLDKVLDVLQAVGLKIEISTGSEGLVLVDDLLTDE